MKVVAATTNSGKLREMREILTGTGLELVNPADLGLSLEVVEDGESFAENALKKARAWNVAAGMPALADDSGLCVDALGGQPGVRSARFAGEDATDDDNNRLLLEKLEDKSDRQARFVCCMALVLNQDAVITSQGEYPGVILDEPRGTKGFGYDPVFLDEESGKTFAQLLPAEKNCRSHRRLALEDLKRKLQEGQSMSASGQGGRSDLPS